MHKVQYMHNHESYLLPLQRIISHRISYSVYLNFGIDVDSVVKQPPPLDRKYRKRFFRRRNSTGSVGVMNSHAFNLQTTGHQAVVVGHHRGFSQPSSANTGDPWFLQKSHEMPPTAPARQHKRPAPQPGILLHSNGQTNHLSQTHHHSQVTVSICNLKNLKIRSGFRNRSELTEFPFVSIYFVFASNCSHLVRIHCIRLPLHWTVK